MPRPAVASRLGSLTTGPERRSGRLRVFPLMGESSAEPAYRLLDQDAEDLVKIEEIDGGSVPNLRITNKLRERLLIVDSQTILGLRQNRTLNTDILIPAGAELTVPVSCVEQGRWGAARAASVSPELVPRALRARMSFSVSSSLAQGAAFRSDQGEVWNEVHCCLRLSRAPSPTGAVHAAYDKLHARLNSAREDLALPPGSVGAAVYLGDQFLGLDLFDKATTMEVKWRPVLNTYALDVLTGSDTTPDPEEGAAASNDLSQLLSDLASGDWQQFDSPGEGHSLRLMSERLVGSALVHDQSHILHMQVFPAPRARPDSAPAPSYFDDAGHIRNPSAQNSTPPIEGRPTGQHCPRCDFTYGTIMTATGLYCNHCGHDARTRA